MLVKLTLGVNFIYPFVQSLDAPAHSAIQFHKQNFTQLYYSTQLIYFSPIF